MINILAVFTGGGLGAVLRYLTTLAAVKLFGNTYAFAGTLCANITGCFIIGYIFSLTLHKADFIPPELKLFLTVGFLGGLTTFSTFSCESFCFIKDGKILYAILYISASLIPGIAATYAGYTLAK